MMRVRHLYGKDPSGCIDVMIWLLSFSIMFFSTALSSFLGSWPPLSMHTIVLWYLLACASIFFCVSANLLAAPSLLDVGALFMYFQSYLAYTPLDFHGPGWM
eukprot:NODE_129_length_18551_cov_0.317039.p13 type:complete len:102 gc:universal NODE_129_length_18551_cov_0.317039:2494-2189(-)